MHWIKHDNASWPGDTLTVISSSEVEAGPDISATKARQAWTPGVTDFPVFR